MGSCPFCGALVLDAELNDHGRWHIAYDLHRHDCASLTMTMNESPAACSCGLDHLASLDRPQEYP